MPPIPAKKPIEAVVFDIGNVLIRWDPRNLYRRMGLDDAASARMMAETGIVAMNHEFDRGKPFAEGIAELVGRHPRYATYLEAWDRRWTEMLDGAIDGNVALMADVRRAGLPLYGLSNFSREKFDIARGLFPFLDRFDHLVVSADVRLIKPDREIFDHLVAATGCNPATSVFIDDSAPNIATARALGFHTIHVETEQVPVRERLQTLGVPV
jgi:2-haloacid dehalogenase